MATDLDSRKQRVCDTAILNEGSRGFLSLEQKSRCVLFGDSRQWMSTVRECWLVLMEGERKEPELAPAFGGRPARESAQWALTSCGIELVGGGMPRLLPSQCSFPLGLLSHQADVGREGGFQGQVHGDDRKKEASWTP